MQDSHAPGASAPASLPSSAARARVLAAARPLAPCHLPLSAAAAGCTLARPLEATEHAPAADLSAVDGYAVAVEPPVAPGTCYRVAGETAAGGTPAPALTVGEAVRVFTGAVLPPGTRAVLKQEKVDARGDTIAVREPDPARNWRPRGQSHRPGDLLLPAGTRLGALEIALLASVGCAAVSVHRRPRLAHLVSGSELVDATASPHPTEVRDANGPLVAALAAQSGAELVAQRRVPDDLPQALAALGGFPAHDVLLLSGGAGHGRHDLAGAILAELGFTIDFRAVDLRPGKPLAFARRGATLAFALPGNPVSHWATWQLFVAPALRRLAGEEVTTGLPFLRGALEQPWSVEPGDREVFWPAQATPDGGGWRLRPRRFVHSGDLAGVAGANALLRVAAAGGRWAADDSLEFLLCS